MIVIDAAPVAVLNVEVGVSGEFILEVRGIVLIKDDEPAAELIRIGSLAHGFNFRSEIDQRIVCHALTSQRTD